MKSVRIGINGFGRIGRAVTRILSDPCRGLEVVAINDMHGCKHNAHMFKYDTVRGAFGGDVVAGQHSISINGKDIRISCERQPCMLPWEELGVSIVLESSGQFRTRDGLNGGYGHHLFAGAKKMILSEPSSDDIDATVVIGVNDHIIIPEHACVSNASCTTNCLAPVAYVLDKAFGINQGIFTVIQGYTNNQNMNDMGHVDLRRARACAENIVPCSTSAANVVGKILPQLEGKLTGMSMRVPVLVGGAIVLVANLESSVSPEHVNSAIRNAASTYLDGVLSYTDDPIVSSDVINNTHSSIVDCLLTTSMPGNMIKVVMWFDNEWGYASRIVDLMNILARMDK